jgi:hypothetical protein
MSMPGGRLAGSSRSAGAPAATHRSMTASSSAGTFFSPGGISPDFMRSSSRLLPGWPGTTAGPDEPPLTANRRRRRSSLPFGFSPPPWQSRQ